MDMNCNWKSQINRIRLKLNRDLFTLGSVRSSTGRSAPLTAYHRYVVSVIIYEILIWGNLTTCQKV